MVVGADPMHGGGFGDAMGMTLRSESLVGSHMVVVMVLLKEKVRQGKLMLMGGDMHHKN